MDDAEGLQAEGLAGSDLRDESVVSTHNPSLLVILRVMFDGVFVSAGMVSGTLIVMTLPRLSVAWTL